MNKKNNLNHFLVIVILVLTVHLFIVSPFFIDVVQQTVILLQQEQTPEQMMAQMPPQHNPAQVVMVPATYLPRAGIPNANSQPSINLLAQPSHLGPQTSGIQNPDQQHSEPMATKPNQEVATASQPERTQTAESQTEEPTPAETLDQAVDTQESIEPITPRTAAFTTLAVAHKKSTPKQRLRELTAKERVMKRGMESKQPTSIITHQQAQKAKPTLADVSQGFMQSVHEQKTAQAQTGEGGIGQGMQIACRRYEDKIWALIEQAIRLNRDQLYIDRDIEMQTTLIVTVGKNGSLIEAKLSHKTGNPAMDNYLLSKPKQAGLFPPIPDSLKKDSVTTQANFRISLKKGLNSMDFIMYAPQG